MDWIRLWTSAALGRYAGRGSSGRSSTGLAALVPAVIYLVTDVLYTLKALALGIWWVNVKVFWLAVIVGDIGWVISLVSGW